LSLGKRGINLSKIFITILIGYLLGNFATSYILGKTLSNKDIRKHGSGNAGATNALRVFGVKVAVMTFLIDALKGVIAVLIGRWILGETGAMLAGASAVVGHNWPVFLKFKGGKGIAATIGVVLTINYLTALICIFIGLVLVIRTKYVSLGSVTAMALLPIAGVIVIKPFNVNFLIFTFALSVFAIIRHRGNIYRLINGQEIRFNEKA